MCDNRSGAGSSGPRPRRGRSRAVSICDPRGRDAERTAGQLLRPAGRRGAAPHLHRRADHDPVVERGPWTTSTPQQRLVRPRNRDRVADRPSKQPSSQPSSRGRRPGNDWIVIDGLSGSADVPPWRAGAARSRERRGRGRRACGAAGRRWRAAVRRRGGSDVPRSPRARIRPGAPASRRRRGRGSAASRARRTRPAHGSVRA